MNSSRAPANVRVHPVLRRWLKPYEDTVEARWTARHARSVELCGSFVGLRILDIGCSNGWLERAALLGGAEHVFAIDLDRRALERAAGQAPAASYVQASATHLPFTGSSLDIVTAFEVLEHVPKGGERSMLHDIHRVLRPGGRLVLSTPVDRLWPKLLDLAWYFGHRHYRPSKVSCMLSDCSFELKHCSFGGGVWELLSIIALYLFKWCFGSEVPFKAWWESRRGIEYQKCASSPSATSATMFCVAARGR